MRYHYYNFIFTLEEYAIGKNGLNENEYIL